MDASYSISGMANGSEPNKKKTAASRKSTPAKKVVGDVSPPKKVQPRKKKPVVDTPVVVDSDSDGLVEQVKKPASTVAPKFKKAGIEDFTNMVELLSVDDNDSFSVPPSKLPKVSFGQRVLGFFHRGTRPLK
jgi:hypothetical protein